MKPSDLHVVTCRANPMGWKKPAAIYRLWEEHMLDSGVSLTVVDCAYGNNPHEHTDHHPSVNYIPVRSNTVTWNKENLCNIGIRSRPEAKAVAWIDSDVFYTHQVSTWAMDVLHALGLWKVISTWKNCIDRGPNHELMQTHVSFGHQFHNGFEVKPGTKWAWSGAAGPHFPHPGYGHAIRGDVLSKIGGLLEVGALGSGDSHMAYGMIGLASGTYSNLVHGSYKREVLNWEKRAVKEVQGSVGFINATIDHAWHGAKISRAYNSRWRVLEKNFFDYDEDIVRNNFGVIELAGNKPNLARDIMQYFSHRNEDGNTL